MRERFEQIYAKNEWQYGSGEGSLIRYVQSYIEFLQEFLKQYSIRSVLDFGCGDWQFSQFIDWTGVDYLGLDLVNNVIQSNQKLYGSDNISFGLVDSLDSPLPSADLIIIKDVMQHWSNESIRYFLPQLVNYQYCLIVNCIEPFGMSDNRDIADGEFRYLDLRVWPFYLNTRELLRFSNGTEQKIPWVKSVQFLTGQELSLQLFADSKLSQLHIKPSGSSHSLEQVFFDAAALSKSPITMSIQELLKSVWDWPDNSLSEIYFEQSLEQSSSDNDYFLKILQELYRVCTPGARVYLYTRHPDSISYTQDPDCQRILSPEFFALLSRRNNLQWQSQGLSFSELALQYQINFELLETEYILSPLWQAALNQGQVNQNQIVRAINRQKGVLDAYQMTLVVHKDSLLYSAPMPR